MVWARVFLECRHPLRPRQDRYQGSQTHLTAEQPFGNAQLITSDARTQPGAHIDFGMSRDVEMATPETWTKITYDPRARGDATQPVRARCNC